MNQSYYTDAEHIIAAFRDRRRQYREAYRWGQANLSALVQRQLAAAQAEAAEVGDHEQVIEGRCFTVDPTSARRYEEGLECIRQLREEVERSDPRNNKLLMALLITGWGLANPWLAVDLLALASLLSYFKMVKAAHAPCPRCGKPFGDARSWPLSVGGHHCQHCDLSL